MGYSEAFGDRGCGVRRARWSRVFRLVAPAVSATRGGSGLGERLGDVCADQRRNRSVLRRQPVAVRCVSRGGVPNPRATTGSGPHRRDIARPRVGSGRLLRARVRRARRRDRQLLGHEPVRTAGTHDRSQCRLLARRTGSRPVPGLTGVEQVTSGGTHTCRVASERVGLLLGTRPRPRQRRRRRGGVSHARPGCRVGRRRRARRRVPAHVCPPRRRHRPMLGNQRRRSGRPGRCRTVRHTDDRARPRRRRRHLGRGAAHVRTEGPTAQSGVGVTTNGARSATQSTPTRFRPDRGRHRCHSSCQWFELRLC